MDSPNSSVLRWTIAHGGQRLDHFLVEQLPDHSRSVLQRWIQAGHVQVDDQPAKAGQKLEAGQCVTLAIPSPAAPVLTAQAIPLHIVYEDQAVIVVDKPAGLVVHPGHGVAEGTLVNALLARYPELGIFEDSQRPGIVHRLDKDTSGVMIVAKHPAAQLYLQKQFAAHTVKKTYWALVQGVLANDQGLIEAAIGRSREQPTQMAIAGRGERAARTRFRVLQRYEGYTLVAAYPVTGRTHQIRLHFAAVGHPIVADQTYNAQGKTLGLSRQFLHAQSLRIVLPSNGAEREFVSKLPSELQTVLAHLKRL